MKGALNSKGLDLVMRPENVEAALWRKFKSSNCTETRTALFNLYHKSAKQLARREMMKRPKHGLEPLDFEQFAYSGLLEAMDRFDPAAGTAFMSFAKHRIRGAIVTGLYTSNERGAQYSHARAKHRDRLKSLETTPKDQSALEQLSDLTAGLAIGFLLEELGYAAGPTTKDAYRSAYESLSWNETKSALQDALKELAPPQPEILKQHYFGGLKFNQIAKLLKLSSGRISQLHRSALDQLRKRLRSSR